MYDHRLYLRTLSEFAHALLTPYDVHAALAELAEQVTRVLGLLGSGVSLAEGDLLQFASGYGDPIADLEKAQQRTQVGPCVTAFRTGEVIRVDDLTTETAQWPEYCRSAIGLGVRSVASIPMKLGEQAVGALNLYGEDSRPWESADIAAAMVMADMATGYLLNASKHRQQAELADQLQRALDNRLIIEQAKGMLAARHGSTPEEAYDRLRRYARSHGATVHAVAEAVVHLGMQL